MPVTPPSLEVASEEALERKLRQLGELNRRLDADIAAETEFRSAHARDATSLARALVEVTSEIRQFEKGGRRAAEQLTKAELVQTLVDAFPTLPADEQKALIARLRKLGRK